MSRMNYSLRLSRHGELSGELLIVGDLRHSYPVEQPAKIAIHPYMGYKDKATVARLIERAKNVHRSFSRREIAVYGSKSATLIPVGFFTMDSLDGLEKRFPRADIAYSKGTAATQITPEGAVIFENSVNEMFKQYEAQYKQGKIWLRTMWHTKREMGLWTYWRLTRKIEEARDKMELAAAMSRNKERKELDALVKELMKKLR